MRNFIRHPTDIPFEYRITAHHPVERQALTNVSHGGISFQSSRCFEVGSEIDIRIPLREPVFEAKGLVVWCRKNGRAYDVGVEFTDHRTEHAARMVEQVAYIESYKKQVREREGRTISGEQAAFEWIAKYAGSFPD
jgi:Tfp pilus assembly protein PilZ